MKNAHASEMARLRWLNTTKAERSAHGKNMVDAREKRKKEKRKKKGA